VIITGLSGAGKSTALKVFEDLGFFCIDNLPHAAPDHADLFLRSDGKNRRVALGIDIRGGEFSTNWSRSRFGRRAADGHPVLRRR
jgi:UPF0042 nucleotide-binding protein